MENCLMHVVVITFVHTTAGTEFLVCATCLAKQNQIQVLKTSLRPCGVDTGPFEVRCPLICGSGMFLSADPLGPVGCWVDAPWIRLVSAHSADWNLGRLESK